MRGDLKIQEREKITAGKRLNLITSLYAFSSPHGGRKERSRTAIALTILALLLILSTSKYLLNLID